MSVALKVNGVVEKTRMVSVGPQASQPIKFTVARSEPGTYAIDIGGQTGSFTVPATRASRSLPVNWNMIAFILMALLAFAIAMILIFNRRST